MVQVWHDHGMFASSSASQRLISRNCSTSSIRNVGVVAHIDAGKTTTTEQMLFISGQTKSVGRVDTGDTVMDFLPQERERGITISSAAISFEWKSKHINLIDTPGHVDFTVEVERSARVLDGAVVIVDAVSGVQAQTRTVWKQTKKQSIPAIAFVNKMDRDGASFERAVQSLRTKLGANAVPIQLPMGCESAFVGLIDLISLSKMTFDATSSSSRSPKPPTVEPLETTSDYYNEAVHARKVMLEAIAEVDDAVMEKYLETDDGGSLTVDDLIAGIRRSCLKGELVPTICGASLRGKGVEPLLDSLAAFLPSPIDRPSSTAVNRKTGDKKVISPDGKDLCALAFKVMHDSMKGPLVYVRTYSGSLTAKQTLYNTTRGVRERINQLLQVSADDLDTLQSIGPGNVACIVGLKDTITGDTLVADKGPLQGYVLDGLSIPRAVYSLAVEPEKSSQQTELEAALHILCMEDPSLLVDLDKESGQTILRGIGELHLEIVCDKLKRQFHIEVTTGRAYVNYRESIGAEEGEESLLGRRHVYDRTMGTKRMYAAVTFDVIPGGGQGSADEPTVTIADTVKQGVSADEYVALVEGLQASFTRGPLGFPVSGINVIVRAIEKDADTAPGAVRACVATFMDALLRGPHKALLEPIMAVEVDLPSAFLGDVLSDLTVQRRGQVKEVVNRDVNSTIIADIPLATMLGYATAIRSMTQGEGCFSMEYIEHAPVNASIVNEFLQS